MKLPAEGCWRYEAGGIYRNNENLDQLEPFEVFEYAGRRWSPTFTLPGAQDWAACEDPLSSGVDAPRSWGPKLRVWLASNMDEQAVSSDGESIRFSSESGYYEYYCLDTASWTRMLYSREYKSYRPDRGYW